MSRILALLLALLSVAGGVNAAIVTTYTDQATFNAALSSMKVIDFESALPGGNTADYGTSAGLAADSNVQFVGFNSSGYFLLVFKQSGNASFDWGSGAVLRTPHYWANTLSFLQVNFSTPVQAFGFDVMTASPKGATIEITFTPEMGVLPIQVPTSTTSRTWIGFAFDAPVSSFQLRTLSAVQGGPQPAIDNFTYGAVNETPEVASLLMIGSGLFLLRLMHRRFTPFMPRS